MGASTDVLFDLDIEGNRPDALSVVGVTRDLAARLGVAMKLPTPSFPETDREAAESASVKIGAPDFCPRFGFRVLRNVTVGSSPAWMQARLTAAGMRPINSIVDISNYVMLEVGQPNHTYDLNLVPDGQLGVRMAREGEKLVTLDDQERTLTADDGVIINRDDQPIGLAGVMGGASTEISDATTDVLLEAAVWERMTIARTARRLNLRSEASTRFERGVDPMGIERALDRFCELAVELCGAEIDRGLTVETGTVTPPTVITTRTAMVNRLLSTELTAEEMAALLEPIGFTATLTDDGLSVTVPPWRPDCTLEADVAEEVGRHHGYDKSGKRVPVPTQAGGLTPGQAGRRRIRRTLLGAGYSEAMPLPFLAPDDLARAGLGADGITLANPLVAEESVLRTSLLPGLLKAVNRNQSHRSGPVRLYELGRVYLPRVGDDDGGLPDEYEVVAALTSGYVAASAPSAAEEAVRALHTLAAQLGLAGLAVVNATVPGLHPTRAAEVRFRGKTIGAVGEVDPGVLDAYEVDGRLAWMELRVAPVLQALTTVPKAKPISLYPSSDIDLAFVTPDAVSATDVARTLKKAGDGLIQYVKLFDAFRSDQVGEGRRSLAFQLRLQAADHTLTDAEVAEVRDRCIAQVAKAHGAELRG
jgi:phenylalanyl-tRNA synthetase beta chain